MESVPWVFNGFWDLEAIEPLGLGFISCALPWYGPDVIGMQEALRFQLDEIERAIGGYAEIGHGREEGTKGEYSAILYAKDRFGVEASGTFWLSSTPEVVSNDWGNANIRICTWGRLVETASRQGFYLFNTHLDHVSQSSREKSVRLIARRIHSRAHTDPFILTGDFNGSLLRGLL